MFAYKKKMLVFIIFVKYLSLMNNVKFQPLLIEEIESLCIYGINEIYRIDYLKSKINYYLNFPMLF